jgi:hypothetical protein
MRHIAERLRKIKPGDRKQRTVWLLMIHGAEGWKPSMDYSFPWSTKKAALKKIKSLGELGKIYQPLKYVLPLLLLALAVAGQAQTKTQPPAAAEPFTTTAAIQVTDMSQPYVSIERGKDDHLLEFRESGELILTIFRDGHIEAKDPSKVDEVAKQFGRGVADTIKQRDAEACKQVKP